jgi:hypothetical protein
LDTAQEQEAVEKNRLEVATNENPQQTNQSNGVTFLNQEISFDFKEGGLR